MSKVFMSYRRDDSIESTGRIYDHLIKRYGQQYVFKDVNSIPYAADFREYIEDSVRKSKLILVIIGKEWIDARHDQMSRRLNDLEDLVRIEIETAIQAGIVIVPILVSGATMPNSKDLPVSLLPLTRKNAVEVRPGRDFDKDLQELFKALDPYVKPHRDHRLKEIITWVAIAVGLLMVIIFSTYVLNKNPPENSTVENPTVSKAPRAHVGELTPELTLKGHNQGIAKLQFSRDRKTLFSAGDFNGNLRLWNTRNGVQTDFLPVGNLYIHAAAMSPDARYAAGSSQDDQTVLYNLETNTKITTLPKTFEYLSYTPDGNYLITSSGDVINSATGKFSPTTLGPHSKFVISKDGKFVIAGGRLGLSIQSVTDPKSNPVFIKFPESLGLPPYTKGIAVNSTMTKAVVGCHSPEEIMMICVVDIPTQKVLTTFRTPLGAIMDAAFSAGDKYYAICGDGILSGGASSTKVVIYDSETNKSVLSMPGETQQQGVHALAFSQDGKYLATGGYSYEGSKDGKFPDIPIKLWLVENLIR